MGSRLPYWDTVRGIALVLVILGHSIFVTKGLDDPIHVFIYSFHMPLFMLISGYFFSVSLKHTIKYILWKRFFYLLLPVILVGTLDWAISFFDIHLSLKENLINWFARCIRTLWFLQAVFFCSMLVLIGHKCFRRPVWFYLLVFILFLLTPDKLQQAGTKAMFPFFVLGIYINQLQPKYQPIIKQNPALFFFISLSAFAVLLIPFRFSMTFYSCGVGIFNPQFSVMTMLFYNFYRILIGFAGSAAVLTLVFLIFQLFEKKSRVPFKHTAKIGQKTLWLYIISVSLWTGYLKWFREVTPPTYWASLLIFIGLFFLSYPLAILMDRLWKNLDKSVLNIL